MLNALELDVNSTDSNMNRESNLRVLDDQDLLLIDGGVGLPGGVVGGVFGGVAYGINVAFNGGGSWGGFGTAVGAGALVGATGGAVSAVGVVWGFNATVAGATASAIVN